MTLGNSMQIEEVINALDEYKEELLQMALGKTQRAAMAESAIARAWACIVDTAFALKHGRTEFSGFEETAAAAIRNVAAAWGETVDETVNLNKSVPVKAEPATTSRKAPARK